jgi:dephospho-CoA kinase
MLIIGLTGGIGSGKTAASDYLAEQGITVVDADQVAREIVAPGEPALRAIAAHFGGDILQADGSLNRAALRQRVFADPAERQALEAITHPAIRERILSRLQASTSPYTLLVSPLLFETGQSDFCERTVVVDAEESLQQARAAARDGVGEDQIARIMAAQMPRADRLARADDVVINHGEREDLYLQLDELHRRYLTLAAGVPHA